MTRPPTRGERFVATVAALFLLWEAWGRSPVLGIFLGAVLAALMVVVLRRAQHIGDQAARAAAIRKARR